MDAHALLSSQGWRGTGHSLHKTDDSVGLAKPILVSRKDNTKGLGQKQHFTSDQWWMNAFDEQLQGLDTTKEGKIVQTISTGKLNTIERGSLGKYSVYGSFVRGGFLEGTILGEAAKETTSTSDSDDDDKDRGTQHEEPQQQPETKWETKEERKEAKRIRREKRALKKGARRKLQSRAKKGTAGDDTDDEKRKRRARKEEKRRRRKEKGDNSNED